MLPYHVPGVMRPSRPSGSTHLVFGVRHGLRILRWALSCAGAGARQDASGRPLPQAPAAGFTGAPLLMHLAMMRLVRRPPPGRDRSATPEVIYRAKIQCGARERAVWWSRSGRLHDGRSRP